VQTEEQRNARNQEVDARPLGLAKGEMDKRVSERWILETKASLAERAARVGLEKATLITLPLKALIVVLREPGLNWKALQQKETESFGTKVKADG